MAGAPIGSGFRYLVAGQVLKHPHQPGMVPALTAELRCGVEQFLRRRGVRQGHAERPRAGQCEAQILLVQFDAEARIEGALDHALAMHFEDRSEEYTSELQS